MSHSTLAFFVRWFPHYLIFGLILSGLGVWGILSESDSSAASSPALAALESQVNAPVADLSGPMSWVAVVVGVGLLAIGWWKAGRLRNGR